uniref:Reverse transcriptase domain-containing protein n=1 Tax=Ananas comosus var. bracteatus TaxID=296719 RepID=A0A6V7NEK3_ANACO|nr:unnamed protein product [Ananas comosus var. bracteatus]
MDVLINPHQAAFIKGRRITDNFCTAHILVYHLHTSKLSAALLKIDFERAFDNINWCFLVDLFQARGFGPLWISWIQALLRSANTSVILNGTPGNSFSCKRGLRQGDPLSPLLFILCVDVLSRMLQRAATSQLLPDLGIGQVRIQTLQFADDLLIFFDGSLRSAATIKLILNSFAGYSANPFGCCVKSFPLSYLGLPLSPKRLCRSDYLPLIERVDNYLAGWKGLSLSREGRLVLLNSVLSTIPSYLCSLFRLLAWVLNSIDKIRRHFF